VIKHIVLLAFKKELPRSTIETILGQMGDLAEQIPEIQEFSGGANCSPENLNRGFTHGFTMTFADMPSRDIYLAHPAHLHVAQTYVLPALQDGLNSALAFDYEF
jgi:hypothetical protein